MVNMMQNNLPPLGDRSTDPSIDRMTIEQFVAQTGAMALDEIWTFARFSTI